MVTPKKTCFYKYPPFIEIERTIGKFIVITLLLLIVFAITKYLPNYQSITDRINLLLLLAFSIFIVIYIIYATPRIKVDEDGLLVEFLWRWLRIGYSEIEAIQEVKSQLGSYRVWIVTSPRLTFFHYLYGLFNFGKLKPCFLVHRLMIDHTELIDEIKTQMKH